MKCCDAEKYIMKYIDGEISQKEGEELNQHIRECQNCKESFLFYDNMIQLLEQMPMYEAPENFETNVMMKIQALEQTEQRSFVKNRILGHIWGTFTVLFGTGAILVFYKQPIINALENTQYFKQWVQNIAPIEQNIAQQKQTVQIVTENVILWTDEVITNSFGIILILLCIVCAVQYIILRRKKEKDRIQHKWIK